MKLYRNIATALSAGILILWLSACEKGPAEKAGEAIDEAASDVAEQAEEMKEAIEKETGEQ